ncbi:hypothetical protein [Novosphingobium olei]|uniref:Uncharacterized protein n=1 Tax=Novosphingobium olei TaxID=2728851 RepID=A0A7Y0BNV1_9SPHN|nr:hypothetical protein [Novosphingobium olei]NML93784.1 hypothetical protein [Novosphingobium olei]
MTKKQSPETIAKRNASLAAWRAANPERYRERQAKCAEKLRAYTQTKEFAAKSSARMKARHADPEWQKVRNARSSKTMKRTWEEQRERMLSANKDNFIKNQSAAVGIFSSASEEKKRVAARWIMRRAQSALRTDTEFNELWVYTHERLRAEKPYEGDHDSSNYLDYLSWLGKATTSDPAICDLAGRFLRDAIPRAASEWRAAQEAQRAVG